MTDKDSSTDRLLWFLRERAKELNCLYRIEEILAVSGASITDVCMKIVEAIPAGLQYTDVCAARITVEGQVFSTGNFRETDWMQTAEIVVF